MSKEAKIGLLLGLVFIVAIAVVLKGVHRNSNSDPGDLLAGNGHVESQSDAETGLGNDGGLDIQKAARQFNENPEPESNEETNTNDPADNGVIDNNNQEDIVNPAPTPTGVPWEAGKVPRYIGSIPSTEPTNTSDQSTDNVFASIGDTEPSGGEWSYVVKKGDMLWNIAKNELGDPARTQEISLLNNLARPDDLKIGQTLRMPARQSRILSSSSSIQNLGSAFSSSGREYIVRQGDTLGAIAINELGSFARWPEIQRLNNLPSDKVLKGQKLRLPERNSTTNLSSSNNVSTSGNLYQVKGGETLWLIAKRELGDPNRWREIQQLNNMSNENVRKGQKIRLPNR